MVAAAPPSPRVQDANALPLGTRLGEFELLSLLGVGGFGIVYLAFDHALEREVAVKEYMPASLAGRTETMHVSLRSQSDADTFALGLRSFVNEARLLARFDHPSLLKVLRFWEANGTAYMAMPVMRGRTLKEQRQQQGRAPDEATLRSMLHALLGVLERLHGEGVFHRDIAPDNIQIEPDGHPVLLDFGAARRVLSDKTQTLTAILKPAYAPIEQYAETGSVKQGPWTDFYALGATLHYVLMGRPPAPATARAVFDESSALAGQGLPGYSLAFLQTVDWMLAPRPADRPQHVAELRQVLLGERQVPAAFMVEPAGDAWDKTQVLPHGLTGGDDATLVIPRTLPLAGVGSAVTGPLAPHALNLPRTQGFPPSQPPPQPPVLAPVANAETAEQLAHSPSIAAVATASAPTAPPSSAAPAARSKWRLVAAAAAAVVAVMAFVLWPKAPPAPAASMAADPVVAAPAVVPGAAPVVAAPAAVPPSPSGVSTVSAPSVSKAAPVPVTTGSTVAAPSARAVPESEVKPAAHALARASTKPGGATTAVANKLATGSAAAAAPSAGASETPAAGYSAAPAGQAATSPASPTSPSATSATAATATSAQANRPQSAEPVAPPAAAAASPETKCAGRNPLSYFVCMERECLRGSFAGHADCQAWRKDAKRE